MGSRELFASVFQRVTFPVCHVRSASSLLRASIAATNALSLICPVQAAMCS